MANVIDVEVKGLIELQRKTMQMVDRFARRADYSAPCKTVSPGSDAGCQIIPHR